jgi:glutamate-1-semialdehyde 2,1-aminomutase
VDGNRYIDHVLSWGPLIFGHAPPRIIRAVIDAAGRGTSFGASTEAEVRLAEKIVSAVPSVEKVRLVNSGTEAVMSAVRLARGFTRRDKVIKFEGNYHGHSDGFLAKAGSGLTTFDLPDSAGVPANLTRDTLTLPYNDADAFVQAMRAHPGEVAVVMLEPVAGNMGVVPPRADFLSALRELTQIDGALLLFDEVITGFRVAYGGAQELFRITPDLTCLGKIIGGGLPLAAYGGRADIMDTVAPLGPVYQAGTLSGNPLAVAAGLAQITLLEEQKDTLYNMLHARMHRLAHAVKETARALGIPHRINWVGSMMTLFFTDTKVVDFQTAKTSDAARYGAFFRALLERGVYFAPSQFEAAFISAAHGDEQIEATAQAVSEALHGLD